MNVVNQRTQRFGTRDVPVVAAARLPEAVPQTRPFVHRHPGQPLRRVAFQVADRIPGDGLLHRLQKKRHPLRDIAGIDKNMNVLRHQDVSPELKTEFRAQGAKGDRVDFFWKTTPSPFRPVTTTLRLLHQEPYRIH